MSAPDVTPRQPAAVTPAAPGRLGAPVDPVHAQRYLAALQEWVPTRRRELDLLDAAVLRSEQRQLLTRDMMLSMALWKAVSDRLDLLLATWDSGRVGPIERERLSSLIWGRLDTTLDPSLLAQATSRDPKSSDDPNRVTGLGLSLPEACRLSDAMVGQLRTRLAIDPNADQLSARIKGLRVQLDRIRDQIELEPPALRTAPSAKLAELERRVEQMQAKLSRGGDIGGLIGPAEIEAAVFERDLIVGGVDASGPFAGAEGAGPARGPRNSGSRAATAGGQLPTPGRAGTQVRRPGCGCLGCATQHQGRDRDLPDQARPGQPRHAGSPRRLQCRARTTRGTAPPPRYST